MSATSDSSRASLGKARAELRRKEKSSVLPVGRRRNHSVVACSVKYASLHP